MERRQGKIIIHASGGTAGKNANTYKLTLPSAWMKAMGISEADREVALSFDGERITIERPLTPERFAAVKRALGHELLKISFYDGAALCTTIVADRTEQTLRIRNENVPVLKTAFGRNTAPNWNDLQHFLEERCIPRARAGLREYLESIGVGEYDPLAIIRKTEGRMAEDDQWMKIEVIV